MHMRALVAGAATAVLIPALAACGSNGDATASSTTPTDVPSQASHTADATTTATALNAMVTLGNRIAAADGAKGKELAGGLEKLWRPVEDGVKAKDPNTYTNIEDAMAGLESGDTGKAKQAATDLETAVKTYVSK